MRCKNGQDHCTQIDKKRQMTSVKQEGGANGNGSASGNESRDEKKKCTDKGTEHEQIDIITIWTLMQLITTNRKCTLFLIPKNNIRRIPIRMIDETVFDTKTGHLLQPVSDPWCILTPYAQAMLDASTSMIINRNTNHDIDNRREFDLNFYRRLSKPGNSMLLLQFRQVFILTTQMDVDITRCATSVTEQMSRTRQLLHFKTYLSRYFRQTDCKLL